MAERHILLFSRPGLSGAFLAAPRPGRGVLVFLPAAGTEGSLLYCPAAGPWASAPNLLTKIPSLFENIGTRGHQSAFLAHFTYKSLLWRQETGTGAGVDVI